MSSVTPVQSKIPASSDQEIFNIVEFKGLNCIENPFSASPGSATDSKNLYLNDEGTLATRPRVHFEQTFPAGYNVKKVINVTKINDNKTFYRILNTSDGYVNLLRINNESVSWETISDDVGMTNSKDQFSVFLNDEGVLFFSCDNGLYYLDNLTFKNAYGSDKAYIPMTKVGSKINDESVAEDFESPNLLTNKYKTSYYFGLGDSFTSDNFDKNWDFSEIFDIKTDKNVEIADCDVYQILCQNNNGDCLLLSGNGRNDLNIVEYNGGDPKIGIYKHDGTYIPLENFKYENGNNVVWSSFLVSYTVFPKMISLSEDCEYFYQFIVPSEDGKYCNLVVNTVNVAEKKIYKKQYDKIYTSITDDSEPRTWSVRCEKIPSGNADTIVLILCESNWSEKSIKVDEVVWLMFNGSDNFLAKTSDYYALSNSVGTEKSYFNIGYDVSEGSIWLSLYTSPSGVMHLHKWTYSNSEFKEITPDTVFIENAAKDKLLMQKVYNKIVYCQNNKLNSIIFDIENKDNFNINSSWKIKNFKKLMTYPIYNSKSAYILTINEDNSISVYLWNNITDMLSYPLLIYTSDFKYNINTTVLPDDPNLTSLRDAQPTNYTSIITYGSDNEFNIKWIIPSIEYGNVVLNILYKYASSKKPSLFLISESEESPITLSYTAHVLFDNKVFLYMGKEENKENRVRWSKDMSAWYWPEKSAIDISDSEPITSMVQVSNSNLAIFKEESALILSETEDIADDYIAVNLKTSLGNIPKKQAIVSSYSNLPMVINENGIQALKQTENVVTGDDIFVSLSDSIAPKLNILKDKQNIKTHNHRYWTYFYYDKYIWVLDNRTLEWYYWELPISIDYMREEVFVADNVDESITMIWSGDKKYSLTTTTYFKENNDDKDLAEDIITYQDYLGDGLFNRIEWRWKTPPLYLNTINYIKKLVSVSLIFADRDRELYYDVVNNKYTVTSDDSVDNLQLLYTFKAYRKKSKFLNSEFSGQMDYVKNLKIKPRLQKFDFVELELTNKRTDSWGNNIWTYEDYMTNNDESSTYGGKILDKLNLIGIAFRFTVSEGA